MSGFKKLMKAKKQNLINIITVLTYISTSTRYKTTPTTINNVCTRAISRYIVRKTL